MKLDNSHAVKAGNRLAAWWQNSKIHWTPRRIFIPLDRIPVRAPIFIIGTQGCGGTIISRTIRRHPDVVYLSGNRHFWAGDDEIHNVRRTRMLPDVWTIRAPRYRNLLGREKEWHPVFGYERAWLYATNELYNEYRATEADWSDSVDRALRKLMKQCIRAYAIDMNTARFTDMSQSFALKVPLLRKIFPDAKFISIHRNPYAMCWREAMHSGGKYEYFARKVDAEEAVQWAAEHWGNTYRTIESDFSGTSDSLSIAYEDFARDPDTIIKYLTEFLGLEYVEGQIPSANDYFPWGSKATDKWYPVKEDCNSRYLNEVPDWAMAIVDQECGALASRYGYEHGDQSHKKDSPALSLGRC